MNRRIELLTHMLDLLEDRLKYWHETKSEQRLRSVRRSMDQIGQLCGITGMNVLDEIQRMQTVWTDDGREVIDLSTREIAMRLDDYASRREASTKEEEETNGIE